IDATAGVEELLRAPILFLNGHLAPTFTDAAKENLRLYLQRGGFLLAEACCARAEFDGGFRALMKEIFPDPAHKLHPLAKDHPIWRSRFPLVLGTHPLWGVDHAGRTAVVYSPTDLSCSWNQ